MPRLSYLQFLTLWLFVAVSVTGLMCAALSSAERSYALQDLRNQEAFAASPRGISIASAGVR